MHKRIAEGIAATRRDPRRLIKASEGINGESQSARDNKQGHRCQLLVTRTLPYLISFLTCLSCNTETILLFFFCFVFYFLSANRLCIIYEVLNKQTSKDTASITGNSTNYQTSSTSFDVPSWL